MSTQSRARRLDGAATCAGSFLIEDLGHLTNMAKIPMLGKHWSREAAMTRLPPEQRRSALIDAALRVISRDGVRGATTRAIVAEAKMPLGSFHYVFRSRDAMLRELIAVVVEQERRVAADAVKQGGDIRGTIRSALQAYFELVRADPSREQAMFELFHYALRADELADLPAAQYRSYRGAVVELLRLSAERAGVRWTMPLSDVARLVITFTDGLTLGWLADRDDAAAGRTMDAAAHALTALAEPVTATMKRSA
jgi:DNA-binding transcriptional regulator YbjK